MKCGKHLFFASSLKDLEMAGIKPADVIYMAYGVEIRAATEEKEGGVLPNFAMCSVKKIHEVPEMIV
jgi:hypothetical protein